MIPVTGNAFSWSVVIGIGGGILETFILEEWILDTSLVMENSFSSSKSWTINLSLKHILYKLLTMILFLKSIELLEIK